MVLVGFGMRPPTPLVSLLNLFADDKLHCICILDASLIVDNSSFCPVFSSMTDNALYTSGSNFFTFLWMATTVRLDAAGGGMSDAL